MVERLIVELPVPPLDRVTEDGVGDAVKALPVLGLAVLVRLKVPLKPFAVVKVAETVVEAPASTLVVEGLEVTVKSGLPLFLRPKRDLACGTKARATVTRLAAESAARIIARTRLLICKT